MTPRELLAHGATAAGPTRPGWSLRVVPNQFPVLRVEGTLDRQGEGLFDKMNGIGAHEVIIESPRHEDTLATLDADAGGAGALGVPRARPGPEARPAVPLHHHLQEPRRGGGRVARSLALAADRAADRAARGARRGGRRARALRDEGALRLLRHPAAGDGGRPAADRGERRHGGGGAVCAALSVRDLDPAAAAPVALRGRAAPRVRVAGAAARRHPAADEQGAADAALQPADPQRAGRRSRRGSTTTGTSRSSRS